MVISLRLRSCFWAWMFVVLVSQVSGCAKSLYKVQLTEEERAVICAYSVPWERDECLDEANEQIAWCEEALNQEHDCWNTLLGDYSRYRSAYPISDNEYFAILHAPAKIKPLLDRMRRDHPRL